MTDAQFARTFNAYDMATSVGASNVTPAGASDGSGRSLEMAERVAKRLKLLSAEPANEGKPTPKPVSFAALFSPLLQRATTAGAVPPKLLEFITKGTTFTLARVYGMLEADLRETPTIMSTTSGGADIFQVVAAKTNAANSTFQNMFFFHSQNNKDRRWLE